MKYGYVRDSLNQKEYIEKQTKILKQKGADKIIIEKSNLHVFKKYRPKLKRLLKKVRPGDSIYVVSANRITRSEQEFSKIVSELKNKKVDLYICS